MNKKNGMLNYVDSTWNVTRLYQIQVQGNVKA